MNTSIDLLKNKHSCLNEKFNELNKLLKHDIYQNEEIQHIIKPFDSNKKRNEEICGLCFGFTLITLFLNVLTIPVYLSTNSIINLMITFIIIMVISSSLVIYRINKCSITYVFTNERLIIKNPVHKKYIDYYLILNVEYNEDMEYHDHSIVISSIKGKNYKIKPKNRNEFYELKNTLQKYVGK